MARWAGRCLCGAVGWESDAPLRGEGAPALNLCHCASCRRQTGAGVIGWVDLPREGFRWLGEATTAYESSPGVTRRFCGICGTPMSWEHVEIPDEVHVMAAHLLDDGNYAPAEHFHARDRRRWLSLGDDLPQRS